MWDFSSLQIWVVEVNIYVNFKGCVFVTRVKSERPFAVRYSNKKVMNKIK